MVQRSTLPVRLSQPYTAPACSCNRYQEDLAEALLAQSDLLQPSFSYLLVHFGVAFCTGSSGREPCSEKTPASEWFVLATIQEHGVSVKFLQGKDITLARHNACTSNLWGCCCCYDNHRADLVRTDSRSARNTVQNNDRQVSGTFTRLVDSAELQALM